MFRVFICFLSIVLSCSDYNLYKEIPDNQPGEPDIEISPPFLEINDINAGCEKEEKITIKNVGTGILEVTDVEYYITYPINFSYDINESENGELPWYIGHDEEKTFTILYTPLDDELDDAFVEIKSNDPDESTVMVKTEGTGKYHGFKSDVFEQDTLSDVDILFVIDNSGSMNRFQTQLSSNFNTFINIFSLSGVDYHIGFITTDNSDFVGDIITIATVDPVAEANSQITSIGTFGNPFEKGIETSYDALYSGEASPGGEFLRGNAKLSIIYVSDEDDFSTTITPAIASAYFFALKSSSSLVVAHAVAGDVPDGCNNSGLAQPGEKYLEMTTLMSGAFLSICSADWGTPMEQLAVDSMVNSSFELSNNSPVEETIEVYVEGIKVYDWIYDDIYNTVIFDASHIPNSGQEIIVNYAYFGNCY
jgi:hypothetical protein